MKYRLNYDKVFSVGDPDRMKSIYGRKIIDLSIYFEYRVYDRESGNEILFTADDGTTGDELEKYIDDFSLNDHFRCSYDSKSRTGYVMRPTAINKNSSYKVEYVVDSCYVYNEENEIAEKISHDTFCDILLTYPEAFDIPCNRPCACTSFGWNEVI